MLYYAKIRYTPALPVILALAVGWAWELLSPIAAQAQSTAAPFYNLPIFVDTKGDTIPSMDEHLPFKVIEGFSEYKIGPGDILEIWSYPAFVDNVGFSTKCICAINFS